MSAYFAGFVVGTLYCPLLIRRFGHIRSFASMASKMPVLLAPWVEPWFWALLRLITGICLVGMRAVHDGELCGLGARPVAAVLQMVPRASELQRVALA